MSHKCSIPVCMKQAHVILLFVLATFSARAYDPRVASFDNIYVTVGHTNSTVGELFSLIEKQTSFAFIYDNNEINIFKEVKLIKGQQLLKDVLNSISKQAELNFT